MTALDWGILLVFIVLIVGIGIYSMRYVRGITDFLVCGRVCGRYVISVADMANGLALISMIGAVEAGYKSGFAYSFWGSVTVPVTLFLSLSGFVYYRFRQTKSISFGQFLEMRYSRKLRIFASTLRSVAEMLANMILPALAGRFFIVLLDLPEKFNLCGIECSTFVTIMVICLSLSISMILFGGSVTQVITDTIQGLLAYPLLAVFVIFVFYKFSWTNEVLPVLMDRVPKESFLNPYDVDHLRDFNLLYVFFGLFASILNRGIGLGAGGGTSAARSPHEQKMAGVLGSWRGGFSWCFYIVLVLMVLVFMNHKNFAQESALSRKELSRRVVNEIIADPALRQQVIDRTAALPVHSHMIGKDKPLSLRENLDTPYLNVLSDVARENPGSGLAGKVPEFRTLFHQLMLPTVLRHVLPPGLMGFFCVLIILMIISTDDSRIFSASLTLSQDLILPLFKTPPSPRMHMNIVRLVTLGVGIFFFIGSLFMSQLEYVTLFVMITYGLWSAGAGVIVLGGLYTRFGTVWGAWSALLSGSGTMLIGILIQRNWAGTVYPWLLQKGWIEPVGSFLEKVSAPFSPYIVWQMTPFKCPVNAVELTFICMVLSIVFYCLVSFLTCREPFNLDRMLHRGKYNTDGNTEPVISWRLKNIFSRIIGITNEYTRGDKIIAWGVFSYTFILGFCVFAGVVIFNGFYPWPAKWWGNYYLIRSLSIPCAVAVITTVWFFIGGIIDLKRMLYDLEHREIDDLDNGVVSGHVSLSDKKKFEKLEGNK